MSEPPKFRSRPTRKQRNERIEECVRLLRLRVQGGIAVTKGDIRLLVANRFRCSRKSVDRYLTLAQARIVKDSGVPREVHRSLVTDKLSELIWGDESKPEVVIAAAKLYSDLHGLVDKSKIVVNNDSGTRQHLHLHGTPLTLDQRKQALLEHLGISSGDSISDDRGGDITARTGDVIEVPCRHAGGSGSAGGRGASDGQGMEIGTEPDAGK